MNSIEKEFVKLMSENQRLVHKVCKIYTDNPLDHDDLFQEITLQLWKSFTTFRGDAKFSTWAYRIALNTAMTLYRKKNKTIETDTNKDLYHIKIEYEEYTEDERLQTIYNAIYQLSDVEKALIMMFLDNKTYREISEILGITEGNARVKMNRAKDKLKSMIKQ